MSNMIVCSFTDASGEIVVGGVVWRFEFSNYFGPLWLNKDRSEKKNQNPSKKVWDAWYDQWYIPKYGEPGFKKAERELNELMESGEMVRIGNHILPAGWLDQ
jgi:hypothetical protein